MNKETVEEAAAWQQVYRAWLELAGSDAAAGMLTKWNQEMLDQWQSAVEPAWQIPLRWLEDMNRIVEGSNAPEPVQTLAMEAIRSGKNGLEAGQRFSARWFQAVSALQSDEQNTDILWTEPAMAARQAWQQVANNVLDMNATLFAVMTGDAGAATASEADEDWDIDVQKTPAGEKSGTSAKTGQSRRRTRAASPPKAQALPPDVTL